MGNQHGKRGNYHFGYDKIGRKKREDYYLVSANDR